MKTITLKMAKFSMAARFCLAVVCCVMARAALAQDGLIEEVVVTGIRASADDFYEIPAVTIRKNADFLVQSIRLVNDSRSPELRRTEIIKTINNLISASAKVKGIEISYGDGFLEPVKLNDEALELLDHKGKSDTAYINLFVKVAFKKDDLAKPQIASLRSFIQNAKLEGRTLIEEHGDIGLSIIEPQKYRYEILQAVSEESKKMRDILGSTCSVAVKGLEGRVFWERVSVGELMLYIGYSSTVTCK